MNKYPFYPFIPAILLALFPAFVLIAFLFNDPTMFQDRLGGIFLTSIFPIVFIGLIGLVFRQYWALWLHVGLWIVCVLFTFYGWFCDARQGGIMYQWLYEQLFWYFSVCILACVFGIWQCRRLNQQRQSTTPPLCASV